MFLLTSILICFLVFFITIFVRGTEEWKDDACLRVDADSDHAHLAAALHHMGTWNSNNKLSTNKTKQNTKPQNQRKENTEKTWYNFLLFAISWNVFCVYCVCMEWIFYLNHIESYLTRINSLWPSDIIRHKMSLSSLVQVMFNCLPAPNNYLNQCLLIVNWPLPSFKFFSGVWLWKCSKSLLPQSTTRAWGHTLEKLCRNI